MSGKKVMIGLAVVGGAVGVWYLWQKKVAETAQKAAMLAAENTRQMNCQMAGQKAYANAISSGQGVPQAMALMSVATAKCLQNSAVV